MTKCECCLFTSSSHERAWTPVVRIGEALVPYEENPTFLGIMFHNGPLAHTWRECAIMSRLVYQATKRSVVVCAAPTWISKANQEKLERAHLRVTRQICGSIRSTPTQVVRTKLAVCGSVTGGTTSQLVTPDGRLAREVAQRTQKCSWRRTCAARMEE